jgi:glycosyltransferase involved in cell wall biosynthesis
MAGTQRVALVHDWLNGMRGGERVLEHFCALYPHADLFTLLYDPSAVSPPIRRMAVKESALARIPMAKRHYRHLLPFLPRFISALPTAEYDLVLSTSHCVAKGAPPPRRGAHLSYVFSPMRYVWDHFPDYLSGVWWKDLGLRALRGPMQRWDRHSCRGVDSFAADSDHIARKIEGFWGRSAKTIYPAVQLRRFELSTEPREDFFLVVSAFVPYKRIDRAIEAARLAGKRLVVVGGGLEEARLKALAGDGVEFAGRVPDDELPDFYRRAQALIFPGEEDFGITALEAQACGTPVIAYAKGGVMETVVEGETGTFFTEPSAKALARVMRIHDQSQYDPIRIRAQAERFSPEAFRGALKDWIAEETRFVW